MAIAEIFLGAFITLLFEKLASGRLLKLLSNESIAVKITKWKKDLAVIKAVLRDAEERQITDTSVKLWLEELQDLTYDMDDILDELYTELSRRNEPESSSTSKMRKFIPSCCTSFTPTTFMLDARASCKIDEITEKLDVLTKQNHALGLTTSLGGKIDYAGQESRATSSVVEETHVIGREEEKAAFCRLLLKERKGNDDGVGRNVYVIPILGMGGVGKTTLAQLVYNDEQVKAHFDHRVWVCISDDFDLLKISILIYDSVAEVKEEFRDLNSVQVGLKKKLSNKKFLVVLDDVWDNKYEKWDQFRVPFLVGAPESTIIVTTRLQAVAQLMGSMEAFELKMLSDNDCITLLARHAIQKPNFSRNHDLKETGEAIARKCGGLPLAAKSLGGILRTKTSLKQWENVLTSKIWDITTQSNDILPALRLSYHHLLPHLKPLFAYCSIFPKDFQFKKDDLILLWMAEGLLNQTEENMQMEELGLEYFNELVSRCFFSNAKSRNNEEEPRFVMHDLINDLAIFVAGNLCFSLEEKIKRDKVQSMLSEKVRHSSFIQQRYGTYRKFIPYYGKLHLRTFLPVEVGNSRNFYLSNRILNELLPKLGCLRVLSLCGYRINELPRSIGDFKHLRYFNMSSTDITQLPESICQLYNLQTLLLQSCNKLNQLPMNIRNLTKLRHLDISCTPALKWMPAGIGMLSSLRTLSKVVINDRNRFQLSELKSLSHLKGTLSIFGMHTIGSATEAREANLMGKKDLDKLEMIWDGNFEDYRDEDTEEHVLDVLKPQASLERLAIVYYGGTSLPSWVGDRSFSCMTHLKISGCKKCTSLPTLGHLPSLRELFIEGMDGVKVVGAEFYGDGGVFASLETLSFFQMICWEEWSTKSITSEENGKVVFPHLGKLTIVECGKLVKVCLPRIQSLGVLTIGGCGEALVKSMANQASVTALKIEEITGISQLDEGIISSFGALEVLRVISCRELRHLWEEEVACVILTKLKVLEVRGCRELVSLGEKEQVLPHNLEEMRIGDCESLEKIPSCCESLRQLEISDCKKLNFTSRKQQVPSKTENKAIAETESSYSENNEEMEEEGFRNLESLEISNCPSMTRWLPTGNKKLPSTFKRLDINECENLEEPENWLLNGSNISSSLESIYIDEWPKLKQFREGFFTGFVHLTQLVIFRCQGIESISQRCFPPSLSGLYIQDCKNLKSMLWYKDDLECLETLGIVNCKNLEFYPPLGGFGEGWPPNLKALTMGEVKQPITEWGKQLLHSLPSSLTHLRLEGEFAEMVSLSELGISLPTLKCLYLNDHINLISLSDHSLDNLTSLEQLWTWNCPKLGSLPEMLLSTLSSLTIYGCPLLKERCRRTEKRDYWPLISHIPHIEIDNELEWGL